MGLLAKGSSCLWFWEGIGLLDSSSSFFVLINGKPSNIFGASSGLQQGDPLFPYLFIDLAEGLGRLIKSHVRQGLI